MDKREQFIILGLLREKQEFQNRKQSKFISLTVILSPQMMGILQQYFHDQFDYGKDLNFVNFDRVSDIIDIRPRALNIQLLRVQDPLWNSWVDHLMQMKLTTSPLATDESITMTSHITLVELTESSSQKMVHSK